MLSYPTRRDLASTYNPRSHEHPYDAVEEYEKVMRVASKHPNKGSSALASRLELPRGRIRPWVDENSKPDVVRGIERAKHHGWLEVDVTTERFDALNLLVAAVFSGGTINKWYVPAFTPDGDGVAIARVRDSLTQLGAGTDTRGEAETGHTAEVTPSSDGSVLGRVLVALGAPHGAKNANSDIDLPEYLDDCPQYVRRDFVKMYLWNRGQPVGNSKNVQIIEERPQEFRESLAKLIEDVAGAPVYQRTNGVGLSNEAVEELRFGREAPF